MFKKTHTISKKRFQTNLTIKKGGIQKMKWKSLPIMLITCILIIATSFMAESQSTITTTENYIIGPGDVLDISVWNNEDLSKLVTVLPDGKIHFTLIGEVAAGGNTVNDLEKELKKRISVFVPNPNLSVMIDQVNSMMIYVIGRVHRPGRFVLNTKINVLQALTMAGGLNPFAKRNKIKIFRKTESKTEIFQFEYDDVTGGKHLKQNIELKRGDVVVVP
jgi:polysaccharide export outer membrane protein